MLLDDKNCAPFNSLLAWIPTPTSHCFLCCLDVVAGKCSGTPPPKKLMHVLVLTVWHCFPFLLRFVAEGDDVETPWTS